MTLPRPALDTIYLGDTLAVMRAWPAAFVHTAVTSPPYWGLRDYGAVGQLGLEKTPEEYVAKMVAVFREVRRVLRDDGTLWLNIGDSYVATGGHTSMGSTSVRLNRSNVPEQMKMKGNRPTGDMKIKDLVGIPWLLAFALRADGWYLRSEIIWHKPNPMPESVTDRPTKAHEQIFLLSKSPTYYYDAEEIKEQVAPSQVGRERDDQIGGNKGDDVHHSPGGRYQKRPAGWADSGSHRAVDWANDEQQGRAIKRSGNKARKPATERGCPRDGVAGSIPWEGNTRNKRSVWEVATMPFKEAHFATFPEKLIEPCVLAGAPPPWHHPGPLHGRGDHRARRGPAQSAIPGRRAQPEVQRDRRPPRGGRGGAD